MEHSKERQPNPEQASVINDLENNIILFASAGTGKTFTVAKRIQGLLASGRAAPEEILCLTFTNRACEEMVEDIGQYVGEEARRICIKTIHGFCLWLVKQEAKLRNASYTEPDICDDADEEDLLYDLLLDCGNRWEIERVLAGHGKTLKDYENGQTIYDKDSDTLFVAVDRRLCVSPTGEESTPDAIRARNATYDAHAKKENAARYACPECGRLREGEENVCAECGYDFRTIPPYKEDKLGLSRPALREYASAMKHVRYQERFYSGDEAADYQAAYEKLHEAQENGDPKLLKAYAGKWMHEYCSALRQSNRLDFDDMIIEAALLLDTPDVERRWRTKFPFITVDEMQDTTVLEYSVLRRLFYTNNVMLCGDFFQTIYVWRGSDPDQILSGYISDYHAKTYMFDRNYRATQMLANASFGYLQNTFPEYVGTYCPKTLHVNSAEAGSRIRIKLFTGGYEEAEKAEAMQLFADLRELTPDDPTKICVMARTNYYLDQLSEYFDSFNSALAPEERLRYFTVNKTTALFKAAAVRDLFAFLRLLINPTDNLSMERLTSYIKGVGAQTVRKIRESNQIGVSITSFLHRDTYAHNDCYHSLIDALEEGNVVVYDTETTGLDLLKDQVVQLGAIRIDRSGRILDTFEEILIPTVEIASGAREIVHYDIDEMIRTRGIDAAEGYRRFSEFVKGAVLVGHNSARFDHAVVSRQLRELGLPPLDVRAEYDTLELAKLFRPSLKNYKLATIIESIGVTNEAAHDAMGDIKATASVLVDLVEHGVIPTGAEREKLLAKHKNKFEKFRAFLAGLSQILADGDVTQLVDEVIHTCKLDSKGKDEATRRHAQKAIADVRDMIAGAQYDDARDFVQSFLINASLSGSQINYLIRNLNQIPLITVHQSKGCEFDTVLIAGADNKSFPTKRAKTPEQINEEKRVFYVAISRAKKRLLLYCAVKASPYKVYSAPSPYLFKLPPETLDWTEYVAPASESCIERLQAQDPDAFRNATILPMAEIVRR